MDDRPVTRDVTEVGNGPDAVRSDDSDHASGQRRVWLSPLAITIEASLISILAFAVATGPDRPPDGWLTVLGWIAATVAGAGAIWFAFRTGARDRTLDAVWRDRRANEVARRRRGIRI